MSETRETIAHQLDLAHQKMGAAIAERDAALSRLGDTDGAAVRLGASSKEFVIYRLGTDHLERARAAIANLNEARRAIGELARRLLP